jgi:hypothetical protein
MQSEGEVQPCGHPWHDTTERGRKDNVASLLLQTNAVPLCPQCGNTKDDPREDSIERLLVCGDSFHNSSPVVGYMPLSREYVVLKHGQPAGFVGSTSEAIADGAQTADEQKEQEMAEWTQEDRIAASKRIYLRKFGDDDADHTEEHARWAAQRGTDLGNSIELQCEVTALRTALKDMCDRFPDDKVVRKQRELLARIPK